MLCAVRYFRFLCFFLLRALFRRTKQRRILDNDDILRNQERHRFKQSNQLVAIDIARELRQAVLLSAVRKELRKHGLKGTINVIALLTRKQQHMRHAFFELHHEFSEFHALISFFLHSI